MNQNITKAQPAAELRVVIIDDLGVGENIDPEPDLSSKIEVEFSDSNCGSGSDPCITSVNRLIFGADDTSLTSTGGVGLIYVGFSGYGGTIIRGGGWNNGTDAGLFSAQLHHGPTLASPDGLGGRCVWAP